MRWSKTFIPTLKETPQDAEAISHKLMVRSGLIRRLSAGAYTYLPLGCKVLRKAQGIIREEMNACGASELFMPALQPVELWKKTGRYDVIGDVMIKFKDRHGKEIALGPTHEEIVTDLLAGEVRSYKDLPLMLYQIQTKFRDEVRPRFGIVRSCEFIMKDAYSFDVDIASMEISYRKMYDAYCRIFERCAIPYIPVEADPGLMGGTVSHEFMVPSEIGEDRIVQCSSCGYAASTEVASVELENTQWDAAENIKVKEVMQVDTPGVRTVKEVSEFLNVGTDELIKTLIYIADGDAVAVLLRGDHEANEPKIKNQLKAATLDLASVSEVEKITGGPTGFSGPVGLSVKILADHAVRKMVNFVAGANKKDTHLKNVNLKRDFNVDEWLDARTITESDPCPKCGKNIDLKHAIEIGHTFKLGTKYSKPLETTFLDENGKEKTVIMGCYGIGVNRILASLIETSYDDDGIIWPFSICPCEVVVIPIKAEDDELMSEANDIYQELINAGVDALIDDRPSKSAGVRFKDADLIGFPIKVVIGKKGLGQGKVEVKIRATKESSLIDREKCLDYVKTLITEGLGK